MSHFNLKGYTHTFSKSGTMSLVKQPPWHFGGDLIEVISEVNPETISHLIPAPLKIDKNKSFLSITMVNMISAVNKEEYLEMPNKCQYKECLIKIYCKFKGGYYWFVPISWVTTDFSLMRGYVMGFGKRLGSIFITKTHELNPLNVTISRESPSMVGICNSTSDINIRIELTHDKKNINDMFTGTGMLVLKHFPGIEGPVIHQISQLRVVDYNRKNYRSAKGRVVNFESEFKELKDIKFGKVVCARSFIEGFTLLGTDSVYEYLDELKT